MNATRNQTWKLFTLTGTDYRKTNPNLTADEADKLIRQFMSVKEDVVQGYISLWNKAKQAGQAAITACVPTPMVVQAHAHPLDDNSRVVEEYFVPDGVCGFAWVWLPYKGANIKFINQIKKYDPDLKKDNYRGGYQYWVWQGNQSMQKKEAFARAMADALTQGGFKAYSGSRMD